MLKNIEIAAEYSIEWVPHSFICDPWLGPGAKLFYLILWLLSMSRFVGMKNIYISLLSSKSCQMPRL